MNKFITVDEAVEKGLKELGLTKETAEIRVLEEGKKKLFGSVKARVEIAALEETACEEKCEEACEECAPIAKANGEMLPTAKERWNFWKACLNS